MEFTKLDDKILKELYEKAQEQARLDYNEDYGFDKDDHWHWDEDTNKHEREYYVFAAFVKLKNDYHKKNKKTK